VSSPSARLFVAVELPEDVRGAFSAWAQAQLAGVSHVRTVAAESLHVTLCFLGTRPVAHLDGIADACRVVAARPAVELAAGDPLWLPRRRPRVLSVSLTDPRSGLAAVQSDVASALAAGGFYAPEDRPFQPHVTVARVAGRARTHPLQLPPPPPLRFDATVVTLFRSRLGSGPARYEALERVALAG
jgi:2'-5' RNA ligase